MQPSQRARRRERGDPCLGGGHTEEGGRRCPFFPTPGPNSGLSARKGTGSLHAAQTSTVASRAGTARRIPTCRPVPAGPRAKEEEEEAEVGGHFPGFLARTVTDAEAAPSGAPRSPPRSRARLWTPKGSTRRRPAPASPPCPVRAGDASSVNIARPALCAGTHRWECAVRPAAREAAGGGGRRAARRLPAQTAPSQDGASGKRSRPRAPLHPGSPRSGAAGRALSFGGQAGSEERRSRTAPAPAGAARRALRAGVALRLSKPTRLFPVKDLCLSASVPKHRELWTW